MKKRGRRVARRTVGVLPLILAILASAATTIAKPPAPPAPPAPPTPPAPPPPPPFKLPPAPTFQDTNVLKIEELSLSPAIPKSGDTVTVKVRIRNQSGSSFQNVDWKISGADSRNGSIASLAGHSNTVVTHTFKAPSGAFSVTAAVDPSNKIAEPASLRADNSVTLAAKSRASDTTWDNWSLKAANKFDKLVNLCATKASITGTINGHTLSVTAMVVGPVDLQVMKQVLTGEGVPNDVATAIAGAFYKTFLDWAAAYRAGVPNAYPGFVAYPAPVAPPMANVPFPLSVGSNATMDQAFSASTIESVLNGKLSASRKGEAGAPGAIKDYASALSGQLKAWTRYQQVRQAYGGGPVPGFAPPYAPVGPVVGGAVVPATSHLL